MDRLSAMEAFVAVAEVASFTRAATRMRMSTAMMTLHVSRLEQHLGVRLFNRTTRRVDLTAEGQHLLTHARTVLDAYATAEKAMRSGTGLSGRVRVDAPASIGHAFIVPALSRFHRLHPDIVLDLSLGDRGNLFRGDGFDIVMRTGELPMSGWRSVPLGMTRLVCLAAPAYAARHGLPETPAQLEQHRCILYSSVEVATQRPWTFWNGGQPIRVRPPASFSFNDGGAIMAATRAGLGITQNLEMLARSDLDAGTLVPVLAHMNRSDVPVVLMGAQERLALPHIGAVLDFLRDAIDWRVEPPSDDGTPVNILDTSRAAADKGFPSR